MKRISTFGKRIKEYRDENKIPLAELSDRTGIPAQTLNRYELEQRVPKVDVAGDIARKLRISELWLQGYEVDVSGNFIANSAPAVSSERDEAIAEFQSVFKKLTPKNRDKLLGYAEALLQDQSDD